MTGAAEVGAAEVRVPPLLRSQSVVAGKNKISPLQQPRATPKPRKRRRQEHFNIIND